MHFFCDDAFFFEICELKNVENEWLPALKKWNQKTINHNKNNKDGKGEHKIKQIIINCGWLLPFLNLLSLVFLFLFAMAIYILIVAVTATTSNILMQQHFVFVVLLIIAVVVVVFVVAIVKNQQLCRIVVILLAWPRRKPGIGLR